MQNKTKNFFLVFLLSALLSVLSAIGVGGPLLFIRKHAGRIWFFIASLLISGALAAFGLMGNMYNVLCISFLVFMYAEARALDCDDWKSGVIAVFGASGVLCLTAGLYIHFTGFELTQYLKNETANIVQQMQQIQTGFPLTAELLLQLLPGILISGLVICLWFSILLENALSKSFRLALSRRVNLLSFTSPSYLVWISIFSFLFALADLKNENLKIVATNVLMLLSVIYFLQGMAITASFMRRLRISPLLRFVLLLLFSIQLFFMISFIGYVDYWVDFRKRFLSKSIDKLV